MKTHAPLALAALAVLAAQLPVHATPVASGTSYDINNPGLLSKGDNMLAGLTPVFTDSDHSWYNGGNYYEVQTSNFGCLTDSQIPDVGNADATARALISKDASLTWTWDGPRPLDFIRIYTRWSDGYRNDISVQSIEVLVNGTWTTLANSAFCYARRESRNTVPTYNHDYTQRVATFEDSEGASLAEDVTGLRITFGDQSPTDDSGDGATICYGCYWEIEAKGGETVTTLLPFTGGVLRDMLHLGSAQNVNLPTTGNLIATDQLEGVGGEANIIPVADDVVPFGGSDYVWTALRNDRGDGHWCQDVADNYTAYFHIYLYVDGSTPKPVRWHFAHDDGMRVWINGSIFHLDDVYVGGDHTQDGTLQPGFNSVTLKIDEQTGGDFLYAALNGENDSALAGVSYALKPAFLVANQATGNHYFTGSTTVDVEFFPLRYDAIAYMVTESSAAPAASDPGWQAYAAGTAPSTVTFTTPGTVPAAVTLYAWFKASDGTITGYPANTLTYDTTAPVITAPDSIELVRPKATGERTIIPGELYTSVTDANGIQSVSVSPSALPAVGGTVSLIAVNNAGVSASKAIAVTFKDGFGPLPNGWITQFLHLGVKFDTDDPAHDGIDTDLLASFGGQANMAPYHGQVIAPIRTSDNCSTPGSLTWTAMERVRNDGLWQPYNNDSRDYYNKYWHIYVISPDSEERAVRYVHSNDDDLRIWVNGNLQVSHGGAGQNFVTSTENTKLYPGLNSIMIKLREGGGGDYMGFAIQKPDGSYFDDLTYSLDPPDEFNLACTATGSGDWTGSPTVTVAKFPLVNGATECQVTFSDDPSSINENAWVAYTYGESPYTTITFPNAMFVDGAELVCYAWFKTGQSLRSIASAPITASTSAPVLALRSDVAVLDAHETGSHTVDPADFIASLAPGDSGLYRTWSVPATVTADGTVEIHAMNLAGLETYDTATFIVDRLESIEVVPDEFFATVSGTALVSSSANASVSFRYTQEGGATTNTATFAFDEPSDGLAAFTGTISGLTDGATYLWWAEATDQGQPIGVSSGSFDTYKIVQHGNAGTIGADVAFVGDDIILSYSGWGKVEFKKPVTASVLLVGGGGGGGVWVGGGGGGGGVVYRDEVTIPAGKYVVQAGAGGVGASWDGTVAAANGGNSSVAGLEALGLLAYGGGAGGGSSYTDNYWNGSNAGGNGGSGGGASGHVYTGLNDYTPGTGVLGQGYDGGASVVEGYAGGGGGAGAPGGAGNADDSTTGGVGGDGIACSITGAEVYYGGGGGGGCATYGGLEKSAQGGAGGGGNGGYLNSGNNGAVPGTDGTDGLGGGGGGAGKGFQYSANYGYGGGHGGRGIVVIRFTQSFAEDSHPGNGGNEVFKQDGYMVHVFRENGVFDIPDSVYVQVFMVGGGGAGGSGYLCGGGGGGAGGVIRDERFALAAGAYDVVIGAGGIAHEYYAANNANAPGKSTTFAGLVAFGGGGGGSLYTGGGAGVAGGSGGGAAGGGHDYVNSQSSGGAGTAGQGYAGGDNVFTEYYGTDNRYTLGAGGGGAGSAGHSPELVAEGDFRAGAGGDGVMCDWTGEERWYAGGGGGGNHNAYWCNTALGGSGVGGNGGNCSGTMATAGAANTGSGGGGGYMDGGNRGKDGGDGASGIVIVRYRPRPEVTVILLR